MDWQIVATGAAIVFVASLLRGLTGFGFAIVAMPLLALVLPPVVAVPVITLLQIASGLHTGITDWQDTDLRSAFIMWAAGIPTILPGLYLLASLPPGTMRLVLGAIVLLSTIFLVLGLRMNRSPRTIELIGAGALSGVMQGAAAMAGPPIILLLLSSNWVQMRCRATLSFVFLLMASASLGLGIWSGIVSLYSLLLSLIFLPGLIIGQMIGSMFFKRLDAQKYRKISILSIAMSAVAIIIRGVSD